MNYQATLSQIKDLARSKILELQPFAGEEMNLLQTDPHRSGFVEGERALAAEILSLIDAAQRSNRPEEILVRGR